MYICIHMYSIYLYIFIFIYLDRPSAEQLQTPRYADAEHYYRRALEGFERTLGPEHGDTWRHGSPGSPWESCNVGPAFDSYPLVNLQKAMENGHL